MVKMASNENSNYWESLMRKYKWRLKRNAETVRVSESSSSYGLNLSELYCIISDTIAMLLIISDTNFIILSYWEYTAYITCKYEYVNRWKLYLFFHNFAGKHFAAQYNSSLSLLVTPYPLYSIEKYLQWKFINVINIIIYFIICYIYYNNIYVIYIIICNMDYNI